MKIRNYIVFVALVFSSIAPVQAESSIVPWSWSGVSSTFSSWGSSALSGISDLSTGTKVAVFGGLSVLTGDYFLSRYGDYFLSRYLGKKYREEDRNLAGVQLKELLGNSDLVRGGDARMRAMTSVVPRNRRYSISDFSDQLPAQERPRSGSVSFLDSISFAQNQPELPGDIQHRIDQLPQRQENSFGRLSPRQMEEIGERRALEAFRAAKRSQAKRQIKEKESQAYDYSSDEDLGLKKLFEQTENGFVLLDEEEGDSPQELLVRKGFDYMRLLEQGQWHQVVTDDVDPILALLYANKDSASDVVNIQGTGASSLLEYSWYKKKDEDKKKRWFTEASTYVSKSGELVVVIPQGVRQHYALPDTMSYVKLSPREDGITISYQEQKPAESGSLEAYIQLAADNVSEVVSPYSNQVAKEIGGMQQLWKIYQGNRLRQAASSGNELLVSLALFSGANVDDQANNEKVLGYTALHAAAENGHFNIVKKLLDEGAKSTQPYTRIGSSARVRERGTVLSLAKQSGSIECAIAILRSKSFKDELDYLSVEKIDQLWASSFENRMDEVTWKLNVIDCVYKAIHQRLEAELGYQRITQTDKDKLQVINNNIGSLWNNIYEKKRTLYSKVAQLRQTPEALFMGIHNTWHANKTGGYTPAQCYDLLCQIGWDENDSDDAFTAKVNESNLDDEKKGVLRQIGFMVRDEAQRELFNIYIKATEKSPQLLSIEDGSVEISPEISQMLSKLSFGQNAQSLFNFYQYLDVSEEGSYVLDNLSQISRELRNRQREVEQQ